MKTIKTILTITILLQGIIANAQTMGKYNFDKYPATVWHGKKAKFDLIYFKEFMKKEIPGLSKDDYNYEAIDTRDLYNKTKINYAGHYVIVQKHSGTQEVGAIIDAQNGKVIYRALEGGYMWNCEYTKDPYENLGGLFVFKLNSRLVYNAYCGGNEEKSVDEILYRLWILDENKKKVLDIPEFTIQNNRTHKYKTFD